MSVETLICPLPTCRRSFEWLAQFLLHFRKHEVARPHQCGYCVERFSSPDALAYHARAHIHGDMATQDWVIIQENTKSTAVMDYKRSDGVRQEGWAPLSAKYHDDSAFLAAGPAHQGRELLTQHINNAACQGFIHLLTEISPLLMEFRGKPYYNAADVRDILTGVMSLKQGIRAIKNIAKSGYCRNIVDLLDLVSLPCPARMVSLTCCSCRCSRVPPYTCVCIQQSSIHYVVYAQSMATSPSRSSCRVIQWG